MTHIRPSSVPLTSDVQLGVYTVLSTYPTAVGGTVQIGITLKIGAGEQLAAGQSSLTLRVREEADATGFTHPDAQNHYDWMVWMGDAGWATPQGNGWVSQSPFTPNFSNAPVFYRLLLPWNTTAAQGQNPQLLGHNGQHSVSLVQVNGVAATVLGFQPLTPGPAYGRGPAPAYANVQNLVIQSVTPSEYFLVQPGQTAPQTFNAQLRDCEPNATYTLTLTIRYTANPSEILKTITVTEAGLSHRLSWDLTDDSGQSVAAFGGYFTYDLTVHKAGDALQQYRSPSLSLNADDISLETDSDGNPVPNSNGQYHVIFKYQLNEAPKAGSVAINFYSDLVYLDNVTGLSEQNRWYPSDPPVDKWLSFGGNLSVRGIMAAQDSHQATYRDHQAKRMLNHNKGRAAYMRDVAFTYNLTGGPAGPFVEWQRVTNFSNGNTVYGWRHANEWAGNSGQDGLMNSDNPADFWADSGATPISNGNNNTVDENRSGKHWNIKISNEYKFWTNSATDEPGFIWSNADRTPRVFADREGRYRKWRFEILDGAGADYHHPIDPHGYGAPRREPEPNDGTRPGSRWWRHVLRVHEDGGQPGTQGCMGALPAQMESIWSRMWQIQHAMKAWGTDSPNIIPYMVYDRNGCIGGPNAWKTWGSGTSN